MSGLHSAALSPHPSPVGGAGGRGMMEFPGPPPPPTLS